MFAKIAQNIWASAHEWFSEFTRGAGGGALKNPLEFIPCCTHTSHEIDVLKPSDAANLSSRSTLEAKSLFKDPLLDSVAANDVERVRQQLLLNPSLAQSTTDCKGNTASHVRCALLTWPRFSCEMRAIDMAEGVVTTLHWHRWPPNSAMSPCSSFWCGTRPSCCGPKTKSETHRLTRRRRYPHSSFPLLLGSMVCGARKGTELRPRY